MAFKPGKKGGNHNNSNKGNNNYGNKGGKDFKTHSNNDTEGLSEVKKAFASVVKGPSANGSIPKNMLGSVKAKPEKVKLTFKPSPQWYNNTLPELEDDGKDHHRLETTLAQKTTQATRLLEEENTKYDENPSLSSSDKNFVSTIMASGTLNDRVSALTLLVQESPLHTTKSLDKLMAMAEKKSRTEAVKSIESLKDLFIGGMLPNRKLKYFQDRPLTHPNATNEHLILWIFEDYLKKTFWKFVQLLKILSDDPVVHVRHRMLGFIAELMSSKPEQENTLLEMLVNKMGDNENKVSAKSSYEIQQLLRAHPGMTMIVVREIERLLMRPRISERAQYYAVITLNQTILSARQVDVANKLIDLYFIFFKRMLGDQESQVKNTKNFLKENRNKVDKKRKKDAGKTKGVQRTAGEVLDLQDSEHSKMIAAVLTGVNRAFPFAKVDDQVFAAHMDIIFRITHTGTFNTSIQALRLIFRVSTIQKNTSDRFYRTLYESLFDPRLILTSKQSIYLNLIYDAMLADQSLPRIKAFVKRLVQACAHHQPPFICGAFYLVSKLMTSKTGLSDMVSQPEDNEEEESFKDAPEDDENEDKEEKKDEKEEKEEKKEDAKKPEGALKYDGRKREPLYSNADKTSLWEMAPFLSHFHPTVSLYAAHILSNQPIEGKPEFFQHALIHFLNRMVYKNPKKQRDDVNTALGTKGSSIMQPMAAHRGTSIMLKKSGGNDVNVNTEAFWQKKIEDVPVDQAFFHKYFTQKKILKPTAGKKGAKSAGSDDDENDFGGAKKRGVDADDDGEDGSDMDEDEVWNAMMGDMPKDALEDVDDDDEDLSDGELEELMLSDLEDEEGAGDDEDEDDEDEDEIDEESFGKDESSWKDDDGDDEEANMFMDEMDDMVASDEEVAAEESDQEEKGRDKKRRKKVALPMFASMEDYAHLIDQEDSE
ncbi:hypothetical protein EC957_007502 [Mortierella hygrophila]|uniref:CCAAT-binding factor domain-containing protein n=1 Tax=Mortierella hygrophila TaxID=979708 RepID=A0A9P6FD37_9FUNG|nr:hypothetical protein EC957_007502 [Mortierella hygrophila]